LRLDLFAAM